MPKELKPIPPTNPTEANSSASASETMQPAEAVQRADQKFQVHMTLQHKGGCTKSFTANMIAQFALHKGRSMVAVDADPSNHTFAGYRALGAVAIDIMDEDKNFDQLKFDSLTMAVLETRSDMVIDNGSTNYHPFTSYMLQVNFPGLLAEYGRDLVLHVPLVGGEARDETLQGLDDVCSNFPEVPVVVWLNESFDGKISFAGDPEFEDFEVFRKHKSKILGLVKVPYRRGDLFNAATKKLLENKLTFDEGIHGTLFNIVEKQRLKQLQREIFEQLQLFL